MFSLLICAALVFVLYYRIVVRREEAYLSRLHSEAFAAYVRNVPRWVPDFSKWRDTTLLQVEPKRVFTHLRDSSLFFASFMLFELLEALRATNVLKPLLIVP